MKIGEKILNVVLVLAFFAFAVIGLCLFVDAIDEDTIAPHFLEQSQ